MQLLLGCSSPRVVAGEAVFHLYFVSLRIPEGRLFDRKKGEPMNLELKYCSM